MQAYCFGTPEVFDFHVFVCYNKQFRKFMRLVNKNKFNKKNKNHVRLINGKYQRNIFGNHQTINWNFTDKSVVQQKFYKQH